MFMPKKLQLLKVAAPLGDQADWPGRDRRWDIVLDRDQRIMLPENGAVGALERVVAMAQVQDLLEETCRWAICGSAMADVGVGGELSRTGGMCAKQLGVKNNGRPLSITTRDARHAKSRDATRRCSDFGRWVFGKSHVWFCDLMAWIKWATWTVSDLWQAKRVSGDRSRIHAPRGAVWRDLSDAGTNRSGRRRSKMRRSVARIACFSGAPTLIRSGWPRRRMAQEVTA